MESRLVDILENLNLSQECDVILQGSFDPKEGFPDNYFTYSCWDNKRSGYYDNQHTKNLMGFQISAYSTDRKFLNEMMKRAKEELEKSDFIIEDDETDLITSQKSHTAKIIEGYFIKKKED